MPQRGRRQLGMAALRNSTDVIDSDLDGETTNDPYSTFEKFYGGVMADLGRSVKTADENAMQGTSFINGV